MIQRVESREEDRWIRPSARQLSLRAWVELQHGWDELGQRTTSWIFLFFSNFLIFPDSAGPVDILWLFQSLQTQV